MDKVPIRVLSFVTSSFTSRNPISLSANDLAAKTKRANFPQNDCIIKIIVAAKIVKFYCLAEIKLTQGGKTSQQFIVIFYCAGA